MNQLFDPSLEGDYSQVYQTEKWAKITNNITEFEDCMMVRVFKNSASYKIQLTSQNNICFMYCFVIDHKAVQKLSSTNKLNLSYSSIFDWLKHIFLDNFTYEFVVLGKEKAELLVYKEQKWKVYLIAKLPFSLEAMEKMRQNISYRFQKMKIRKHLLEEYQQNMKAIIKTKNPSLFSTLNKKSQAKTIFK